MFSIDDYVLYKHDVCRIVGFNNFKGRDYYVLKMVKDESLTINVPIDNCSIRSLISKNDIYSLIKKIPSIPVIQIDSKNSDHVYKSLLDSGTFGGLISIIKVFWIK